MKRARHYLNRDDFMRFVEESHAAKKPTTELLMAFQLLVDKLSLRPNFRGYTYLDEMKQEALMHLWRKWHTFDHKRFDNPHAFFTTLAWRQFTRVIKHEKRERQGRDQLYWHHGMKGSTASDLDFEEQIKIEVEREAKQRRDRKI